MKYLMTALISFVTGALWIVHKTTNDIEDGDVIYENEDFYVKATKDKRYGGSHAEVRYKKSNYNDDDVE